MHWRTVIIPDELDRNLRREARRRGITVSEVTRQALESHLGSRHRKLAALGTGSSGVSYVSERIEGILRSEAAGPR